MDSNEFKEKYGNYLTEAKKRTDNTLNFLFYSKIQAEKCYLCSTKTREHEDRR